MLTKYGRDIADRYGIKVGGVNKLFPNLNNKTRCVAHYTNLQLYFSLGIKLHSFHKILEFKKIDWLKKYIEFNTDKRKNTVNSFKKRFF